MAVEQALMIRLALMRRLAGYALAAVPAPLLAVLLAILHGQLNPVADGLASACLTG
jgi:hypothetical protein